VLEIILNVLVVDIKQPKPSPHFFGVNSMGFCCEHLKESPNQTCYRFMGIYWFCESCIRKLREGCLNVKMYACM